jgi:energy-coupling factor transporter ATP-binding protein EcfA2
MDQAAAIEAALADGDKRHLLYGMGKDALVKLARAWGWKGDDARTPKSDLVEFCAVETPDSAVQEAAGQRAAATVQAVAPAAPAPAGDAAAAAVAALQALIGTAKPATLDPEQVRAIVADEVARLAPRRVIIEAPQAVELAPGDHLHPMFGKVLRLVRAGLNVMLVGPAGSGKTTLAAQVAKAMQLPFSTNSCSAGMSESQLSGWLLPTGDHGRFEYVPSPFVTAYENGGLHLFDEMDAADSNTLVFLNSAFANGHMSIAQRFTAPTVTKHSQTVLVAACNTFGTGADAQYVGRNAIDAATLDRFYVIQCGYIDSLERAIAGLEPVPFAEWEPCTVDIEGDCQLLGRWILALRDKAATAKLRRVISTRMIQKAVAARRAGVPMIEVRRDLLAGWTRDELAKVQES